ncbi:MAG: DUF5131 family protein [Terriglobales bacterium]
MAENSLISWTHNTQNFWVGCTKCAPECAHCYIGREIRKENDWELKRDDPDRFAAEAVNGQVLRQPWGNVHLTKTWNNPAGWENMLVEHMNALNRPPGYEVRLDLPSHGRPDPDRNPEIRCAKIFTNSLADFFDAAADSKSVSPSPSAASMALSQHRRPAQRCGSTKWRDCAWQVIRETPHCIYQILTKRPENIMSRLPVGWPDEFPNVWLGVSTGCRRTLDKLDILRKIPVHPQAVRFVSCEPLLEDIAPSIDLTGIGWLIAGGESGTGIEYQYGVETHQDGRRTMKLSWARNLKRLCYLKNIPFFFKQVTARKAGTGADALGEVIHECPPPPYGEWVADNFFKKGGE